jgi:hypothetical protein
MYTTVFNTTTEFVPYFSLINYVQLLEIFYTHFHVTILDIVNFVGNVQLLVTTLTEDLILKYYIVVTLAWIFTKKYGSNESLEIVSITVE